MIDGTTSTAALAGNVVASIITLPDVGVPPALPELVAVGGPPAFQHHAI
jgi:hypothetical protein